MPFQLQLADTGNNGIQQLLVIQDQGDNTPIAIRFPYDITGVTFSGTIAFPAPVLLSIGNGVTVTDAANGRITLQLTSEQTQNIPQGQYPFDLWTSSPGVTPVNTDPLTGFFVINTATTRIS